MNKKQIHNLTEEELDNELFREIDCSWDRKALIDYVIDNLRLKDKLDWVEQWFEFEEDNDEDI